MNFETASLTCLVIISILMLISLILWQKEKTKRIQAEAESQSLKAIRLETIETRETLDQLLWESQKEKQDLLNRLMANDPIQFQQMQAGSMILSTSSNKDEVKPKAFSRLDDMYHSNLDENGQLDEETREYLTASGYVFPES